MSSPERKARIIYAIIGVFGLLLVGGYLLRLHYVQDYSDPIGFVIRAQQWATVGDHADRAPLYPVILYGLMQVLGQDWVFVANIPFILLLLVMLGVCTKSFFRDEHERPTWVGGPAVLLPGAVFFAVRWGLLQQMVNPYREPIALLLLLTVACLFVKGWNAHRSRTILLGIIAGLLLGLATSIRETSLLLILALGLWGLREIWEHRKIPFGFCVVFGLGLLIGLLPLLIKNYQFSGSSLVPAYSAGRVTHYAETGAWDIPIPGMSIRYFRTVAPFTLRETIRRYTWFGGFFFLVGLLVAFKRRNRDVTCIYFPAFLIYFLFHCFYNRYLGRYLLTAEIFVVPVLVYGIIESWCWFEDRLRGLLQDRIPVLRWTVGGYLACLCLLFLMQPILRGDARTKIWNLPAIRSEIKARIEEPAIFMGHRHFCYRMSWLLDQSFYEYAHRFQNDHQIYDSLDERLRAHGQYTVDLFSDWNYYIDESTFALASNWLQREPVFDFADLSVPFERYGRPLRGNLYRVKLWQQNEAVLTSERARPAPAVLMLDMRRPWDYSGRTMLTGVESVRSDVVHTLTNGVQFIELPRLDVAKPFSFKITSDAPVPPAPVWRLLGLSDDITLAFGMGAEHWAWNRTSATLYPNRFIPHDAAQLYDSGEILLPVFAETGLDVFAEVRIEFIRTHAYWHEQAYSLRMQSDVYDGTWGLPPSRHQGRYVIPVGAGSGVLEDKLLRLRTTLPSHEVQQSPPFSRLVPRHAFVKVYDIRVFTHARAKEYPILLDVGGDDAHAIGAGFFAEEKSGAFTGRWTSESANIRVGALAELPKRVRVRLLPLRPPTYASDIIFALNGHRIAADLILVTKGAEYIYEFPVDPLITPLGKDWLTLKIETASWNPAREGLGQDHRDLGVFVTGVEFY